jgi:hypothetical protein
MKYENEAISRTLLIIGQATNGTAAKAAACFSIVNAKKRAAMSL